MRNFLCLCVEAAETFRGIIFHSSCSLPTRNFFCNNFSFSPASLYSYKKVFVMSTLKLSSLGEFKISFSQERQKSGTFPSPNGAVACLSVKLFIQIVPLFFI